MNRMSITDWAAEIQRQNEAKRDFVADSRHLMVSGVDHEGNVALDIEKENPERFTLNPIAERQVADKTGIPYKYWERMKEDAPQLLARNANHWFQETAQSQLIRTLDGKARAYLSDRYAPIDNGDIAEAVLPVIGEFQVDIKATEVTDRRMYLKVVFPRVQGEVQKGDVVQAGIVVSNSEVGLGRFHVQQFLYRLVCLNGMVGQSLVGKVHLGASLADGMDVREVFSEQTRRVSDEALMLQTRDVVRNSLEGEWFQNSLSKMRNAAGVIIDRDTPIEKVVERTAKDMKLSKGEGDSVLRNLIEGGDLTAWGMANAITATARDTEDYDRVIELERVGNRLIEKPSMVAAA